MDCHRNVAEGIKESLNSIKAYCIQCHDESYGGIADRWKSTAELLVRKTELRLNKMRSEIQQLERMGKHTFAFTKSFGDAEYNLLPGQEGEGGPQRGICRGVNRISHYEAGSTGKGVI